MTNTSPDDLRTPAQEAGDVQQPAEPVCGYASYRNHKCALPSGHQGEHNSRADGTGSFWGTDPDDEPLKPDCSPTGLTREEVEACEAGAEFLTERAHKLRGVGAVSDAKMRNEQATTLRNLAARK
jgi:hypothetical protein